MLPAFGRLFLAAIARKYHFYVSFLIIYCFFLPQNVPKMAG